jgi:hypothetical protein
MENIAVKRSILKIYVYYAVGAVLLTVYGGQV